MSEELKPCPFCGGKAKVYSNFEVVPILDQNGAYIDADTIGGDMYWVQCCQCKASTDQYAAPLESEGDLSEIGYQLAIEAWNRRANDEKQ